MLLESYLLQKIKDKNVLRLIFIKAKIIMLLGLESYLNPNPNQLQKIKDQRKIFMIVSLIITLPFVIPLMVIMYKNNKFVFNCKNGSVLHWILANAFSIFYYIYTLIGECSKKQIK